MFEPNYFWEKRAAALETLVLNLCQAAGMAGLIGAWHQQLEALKNHRADQVLGVVTVDENSADGPYVFETIRPQLLDRGLLLDVRNYTSQEDFDVDLKKRAIRLTQLQDLDQVIGPHIYNGLYRIDLEAGGSGGNYAPVLVLRDGEILNFFIFSDDSMSPMSLALGQMPKEFDWENPDQRFHWRSEVFLYRSQISKMWLDSEISFILSNVNWDEMDQAVSTAVLVAQSQAAAANDAVVGTDDGTTVSDVPGDTAAPGTESTDT